MIEVVIASITDEAIDIRGLELTSLDGMPLPRYDAGAHIDVHLPGDLVRQYSLCKLWRDGGSYRIGVLRDQASRGGSLAIHADLRLGDRLWISEPRNLFALVPEAAHSLLFAGGIGITPILCMAEQLALRGAGFDLHYSARAPEHAAFLDAIRRAAFADSAHFHFDNADTDGKLDVVAVLDAAATGTHVYVCGPEGYMNHVLETARVRGWNEARLHREYFSASRVEEAGQTSFEVQIASTGQVWIVPAERSIFQVLDEAGIFIPVSCEQGVCGTCLTGVLAGEPDHRDIFLSDEEHARNDQMAVCCSRARSPRLLLDL